MTLIFATQNANKVREIKTVLPIGLDIVSLQDIGFAGELQEDYQTLEENAKQKAIYIYEKFGQPCFSEDTGLEVYALNGAPGVNSARYAGDAKDPVANMRKLLAAMSGEQRREAIFKTVIAFKDMNTLRCFSGVCEGVLSTEIRGDGGFGYDPIFIPKGYKHTFAELGSDIKHRISHRTQAVREFSKFIESYISLS